MSLTIRSEETTDADGIAEVTRLAFTYNDGVIENRMVEDFRASDDFNAEFSLVALLDGVLVGHVMVAPAQLGGDEGNQSRLRRVLLLGPISVIPAQQNRGIGSALMREILRRVSTCPEPMVVLRGHPSYYPRFGFRPAREFGLLPEWDDAMIYPLQADLSAYAGLSLPH